MKTRIYKLNWGYEKEEAWLNSMAAKGLALTDCSILSYSFEDTLPGEYIIRSTFLDHHSSHPETIRYIRFMEESGAEHVASNLGWAYFRKKAADGPFEIFSDIDSHIKLNRRISSMYLISGAAQFIGAAIQFPILIVAGTPTRYWSFNVVVAIGLMVFGISLLYGWQRRLKTIKKLERDRNIYG